MPVALVMEKNKEKTEYESKRAENKRMNKALVETTYKCSEFSGNAK